MFIARQPIFNRKMGVYGYELLFRSDESSGVFDGTSAVRATATVISGLYECGVDCIVDDKFAFINFDEHFICSGNLELIEPERLIVEVLETVKADEKLIRRIKELKKKGYKIALDDFVEDYESYPLVPLADIIKFDIMATPLHTIKAEVHNALVEKKIILAEKIETEEEFLMAKDMGFHLFQGFFFSKPKVTNKTFSESTSKTQYYKLIRELKREEPSFQRLAEIIERDVTLSYRLLRVVSTKKGEEEIYSIKRALAYMGLKESERWVHILMLQDIGKEKPNELMRLSLVRTKFAENLAMLAGLRNLRHEASMMGLFSVLDAMLDMPMEEAIKDVALSNAVKDALINEKGSLYPIYVLTIAYEKGDWATVSDILRKAEVDESIIKEEYMKAIKWAKSTMGLIA